MKSKLLLLSLALVLCASAHGQVASEVTTNDSTNSLKATIVRTWDANTSVQIGIDQGKKYLIVHNHTPYYLGLANSYALLCNLPSVYSEINDLQILNDIAYFCGKTNNQVGFIGYVDLNAVVAGTYPIIVNWSEIPEVTRLHKMAVYKNSAGREKAVAIGWKTYSCGNLLCRDNYVVEVPDILTPSSYLYANFHSTDVFVEVLFTRSQRLCFVEVNNMSTLELGLRLANPDNVLLDPAIANLILFPTGTNEVLSQTHSASYYDQLSVSYLSSNGTDFTTKIRYFDLSTKSMTNAQEFVVPDKVEPWEMTYYYHYGNPYPMLLIDYLDPTWTTRPHFIRLEPTCFLPYASKSHYTTDNFNSLDCFNNQYIVSVGDNKIFHLNCDFNFSMFMGCPNPNPIVIDPIDIATPRLFNISPIVNGGIWSNIASPQTRITHQYMRTCSE